MSKVFYSFFPDLFNNLGNSSVTELNDEHKKKLLMHETGHCLGLADQNGTSSVATTYIDVFNILV